METGYSTYQENVGTIVPPSTQKNTHRHTPPDSFFLLLFVLLVVALPYFLSTAKETMENIAESTADSHQLPTKNPFDNLGLEAQAVYVLDVAMKEELFSYNAEEPYPLASLTKIMTTVVVAESIPRDTVVVLDYQDIAQEGDSGLLVGERWRLLDMIDFTLTTSSNDGASALAAVAGAVPPETPLTDPSQGYALRKQDFVTRMNAKASALSLTQTYFLNESGLDMSTTTSGAYGSAVDVGNLFAYAIATYADFFDATSMPQFSILSLSDFTHRADNTNKSINNIPGFIAGKTGYTDLAGGNLVVAFDAGIMRPIVVVVLGSSKDGRFVDVEKLVQAARKAVLQ